MIGLCLGCCFEYWKDIFQICAYAATIFGVIATFIVALHARKTYKSNNSIKRWEMIERLYSAFISDDWYEFYERVKTGGQIESSGDIKLLNKTLTLFDALNYLRTQELLDKRAWEYIACEILNFALNNSVWEYMNNIKKPYIEKGFHKDIIPFTGFPDLYDALPDKFKMQCLSKLEEQFNKLSSEEQNIYYGKAKNIPDERLQLKRAVAFCVYYNNKEK